MPASTAHQVYFPFSFDRSLVWCRYKRTVPDETHKYMTLAQFQRTLAGINVDNPASQTAPLQFSTCRMTMIQYYTQSKSSMAPIWGCWAMMIIARPIAKKKILLHQPSNPIKRLIMILDNIDIWNVLNLSTSFWKGHPIRKIRDLKHCTSKSNIRIRATTSTPSIANYMKNVVYHT